MGDVYLYLDEVGDLNMSGQLASSDYFGLGSAIFVGDHNNQMWEGTQLRFAAESQGVNLPKGFHANNVKKAIRHQVFEVIARQRPRIDVTLLRKERAYPGVLTRIEADEFYLYQLAWFLHFKFLARYVMSRLLRSPSDRVYVVAATLGTGKRKKSARAALERVCLRFPRLRLTLCVWDSDTSWGLQVADYGLWTAHRYVRDGSCDFFHLARPVIHTIFQPWEDIRQHPAKSVLTENRDASLGRHDQLPSDASQVSTATPPLGPEGVAVPGHSEVAELAHTHPAPWWVDTGPQDEDDDDDALYDSWDSEDTWVDHGPENGELFDPASQFIPANWDSTGEDFDFEEWRSAWDRRRRRGEDEPS